MSSLQPLKEKTIVGLQWNLIGQIGMYVVTLGGTVALSRILSPAEFGLFGMLTVLSSLASLVVGLGLAHAIVQNQDLEPTDYSSIFWLNLMLGVVVGTIFFFGADYIAVFYRQPELATVTRIFSFIFLIYGCSSVPLGLLSKRLAFKELVFSQLVAATLSYGTSIAMASYGWGVWSLVAQAIVNHLVYVSINLYLSQWIPTLNFSKSAVRKIARFSRNFLPSQTLDFFSQNLDMLLIGKFFGKTELGYYGRASALVQLPINSIGNVFNKTFFAVFAALQPHPDALNQNYLRAVKYLSLCLMPILVLTAVASDQVILFLFGSAWVEMAPFASFLAISAAISSYNNFNDSVIISQGRTDLLLRINVAEKLILMISIVIGLQYGLTGIVYAKIGSSIVTFIPKLLVLSHVIKLPAKRWFTDQRWIFLSLVVCGICGYWTSRLFDYTLLNLVTLTTCGLLAMLSVLLVVREHSVMEGWRWLKNLLKQKKNS